MTDLSKLEQEYKEVKSSIKSVGDDVKSYAEKTEIEIKNTSKLSLETKALVDESLSKFNDLNAKLVDLEQKLERPNSGGKTSEMTVGEIVASSEQMNGVDSSFKGSLRFSMPKSAIMTIDGVVNPQRVPIIITPPESTMTIRDLIAPGETDSNAISYIKETGFTNNADVVGEGDQKPYSELEYGEVTANVKTIAHLFKASRQILDDMKALRSLIDARAKHGLKLAEERQLLYGDGTGNNLFGIVPQASTYTPSITLADSTPIDTIRLALLQAVLAEYPADGIVLNPIDWAAIELTKDKNGNYIIGDPIGSIGPRLWSLPVVATQAMIKDDFLVGSFKLSAQIFDRLMMEVLISTENVDDFERNMVSIRAEERLALAVYRPESFVSGSFS